MIRQPYPQHTSSSVPMSIEQHKHAPPASNTGAQSTPVGCGSVLPESASVRSTDRRISESGSAASEASAEDAREARAGGVAVSIDWLAFTVPSEVDSGHVFGVSPLIAWADADRGLMGYSRQRVWGTIRELWAGQPGMGRHFEIPGSGCRQLEAAGVVEDWPGFLAYLAQMGAHFSRVDVALDDRAGYLDLAVVEAHLREGLCTTRWRQARTLSKFGIGRSTDGGELGHTVYVGSAQSDVMVRFYDKAAEKGEKDGHWVRCEVQFRDERAESVVSYIVGAGVGAVVGVLRGYLEFRTRGVDSNKSRWGLASWWASFVGAASRARLEVRKVAPTLDRVYAWLRRQVAPTLAMLAVYRGGDVDFTLGELYQLTLSGADRLRPKHRAILASVGAVCAG